VTIRYKKTGGPFRDRQLNIIMNILTIQSELTLAGILTMYLYYYYLPILSNKKTGDPFPDRQLLTSPPKINYKNNPIPIKNNIPLIIITRGAICSSSIGFLFMCYSWGNRVPFGILLFTPNAGRNPVIPFLFVVYA